MNGDGPNFEAKKLLTHSATHARVVENSLQ
jgi:hypothetical protein